MRLITKRIETRNHAPSTRTFPEAIGGTILAAMIVLPAMCVGGRSLPGGRCATGEAEYEWGKHWFGWGSARSRSGSPQWSWG